MKDANFPDDVEIVKAIRRRGKIVTERIACGSFRDILPSGVFIKVVMSRTGMAEPGLVRDQANRWMGDNEGSGQGGQQKAGEKGKSAYVRPRWEEMNFNSVRPMSKRRDSCGGLKHSVSSTCSSHRITTVSRPLELVLEKQQRWGELGKRTSTSRSSGSFINLPNEKTYWDNAANSQRLRIWWIRPALSKVLSWPTADERSRAVAGLVAAVLAVVGVALLSSTSA